MAIRWSESQAFQGSIAQRGVRNTRHSIVKRIGYLEGLDDTVASYNAALNFAQVNWSSFDPIEGLPRQTIKIEKLSATTARAEAVYALTPGVDINNLNAMEQAQVQPAVINVVWYSRYKTYSSGNYGGGGATNWHDKENHKLVHHPVTVWQFIAHMSYGSSPLLPSIRAMANKVNANSFSVGGIVWPQHAVRFDSPRITVNRIGTYTLYETDWAFTVREDGWYQERPADDVTKIAAELIYDTATFAIPTDWTPS